MSYASTPMKGRFDAPQLAMAGFLIPSLSGHKPICKRESRIDQSELPELNTREFCVALRF
jgi:hypothetical protein